MKKAIIFVLLAVLVTDIFASRTVMAMPSESLIRDNCGIAQTTLLQIEKADAVVRINRGHDYTEALNLMFAMNARLATNQIAAPELTTVTADFSKGFDDFRSHYDVYDDTIAQAISIKCTDHPVEFYVQLERTRTARAVLRSDIDTLNTHVRTYYDKFDTLIHEAGL